jgi:Fe(II)/alpha-ketoglutarate-dependent arginine beta-hydroxylase
VEYTLTPQDLEAIDAVVAELRDSGCAPVSTDFYDLNWGVAARLPDGLRSFLERFHRTEVVALGLVHGFPLDDESVGPTPGHWEGALDTKTTLDQEFFMAMCGLALGDPFTWTTLQSSLMIQNILPIRGDEQRQSGHGSEALLEFHTEDGFHPARCDYLMLLGIRNHDRVPTIVASIRDVALSAEHRTLLSEDRYYILPDDEHVRQLEARHPDHPALARVIEMQRRPTPVRVLFGSSEAPYLRIDRPFMRCVGDSPQAERALDALMEELEQVSSCVVIEPGSMLILDNYLAVHGRKPFKSRYDGTDRWLKRMLVSRDLRKSAASFHSGRRVLC